MDRIFVIVGALSAFLAVGAGAFGAHALRKRLNADMLNAFEVGVRYHMYHALGLIVVGWARAELPGMLTAVSGWLFVGGTILFSGSLYLLSLTGRRWLGAITPLGGLALLGGWLALAVSAASH